MNKLLLALILGGTSLLSLSGCKQLAEARKAAEALNAAASAVAGSKAPSVSSDEEKDAELGDKLGQYISCMNGTSKRVVDSRNRYLSWVNEKTGPTGKEPNIYGLYAINASSCLPSLDKAKTMPPALPDVESSATDYRNALEELDPIIKRAVEYYDQKNYKGDKMAQGKAMHPQLMSAFAKFEPVNKTFEDRVTALNDAVNARQFARLEKDPARRLQYLSQKSLTEAKAVIKLTDITQLKELELQPYEAAVHTFDQALTELEQYAGSHKAEVDKATMFSSYVSSAQTFLKSAKALLQRKRDNKDFNKEFFAKSSPNMVDGHPAQVVETYNRMISDSNNLRYGN